MNTTEQLPLYTIIRYTDSIYKVIKFKRRITGDLPYVFYDDPKVPHEGKFYTAISRAKRMIFEYAMCNSWDYFFTGTFSKDKINRYDFREIYSALKEWIKYRSDVYDQNIQYLFIPELHGDGAYHIHGFISGVPDSRLSRFDPDRHPFRLVRSGFLNWPDWEKKFGFCSLGRIRNKIAVSYYITKYVTKDLNSRRDVFGGHLYYVSRGLLRASKQVDVYLPTPELDALCDHEYDFCCTGLVENKDWTFGFDIDGAFVCEFDSFSDLDSSDDLIFCDFVDDFMSYEDLLIEGFT